MIRSVGKYPDKRLNQVSKEITSFDAELHKLLDDMFDTMIDKRGVGLAGIQIGVAKRVLIINIPIENAPEGEEQPKENTLEIINPKFLEKRGVKKFQEGCLSVPGFYEDVERAEYISIEYYDRYGDRKTLSDDDFLAIAIQHEMDHLDGKLFIEKLSYTKRKKFEKEWKKRLKSNL